MLCNEYRRTLQTWLQYWETPYFNKSVQFVWPPFNGLKVYSHLCTTEQIYTAGILHLQVGILPRSSSRTGTDWNGPEHLSINFHGTEWTVPTGSIVHELRLLPISVANSSKIFLSQKHSFTNKGWNRVEMSLVDWSSLSFTFVPLPIEEFDCIGDGLSRAICTRDSEFSADSVRIAVNRRCILTRITIS